MMPFQERAGDRMPCFVPHSATVRVVWSSLEFLSTAAHVCLSQMIVFRQLNEGYSTPAIHWHVEYFDTSQGTMFPVGTAYVIAPTIHGRQFAQLNFVFVSDAWRRRGIADQLILACKERWPSLTSTGPMNEPAAKLIHKHFSPIETG
jgi:GNAT superfamily N-acetyltransferase